MSENIKTRSRYIDISAGLMLIWMMVGHVFFHAQHSNVFWDHRIYLGFFMPWFFFKSGMFFSTKDQKSLFRKDYAKLIIPFLVWAFVGQFVLDLIMLAEHETNLKPYFYGPIRSFIMNAHVLGNGSVWFLWSLFLVHQIANLTLKKIHPLLMASVGLLVAFGLYKLNFAYTPRWIMNVGSGLFFFGVGNWMKERHESIWWIVVAIVVYTICCVVGYPMVHMYTNTVLTGNYLLWFPASVSGILILMAISKGLEWLSERKCLLRGLSVCLSGLEHISKNAMNYYLSHWIVLMVVVRLIAKDCVGIVDTGILMWIGLMTLLFVMPIVNWCMNSDLYLGLKKKIDNLLTPKKWNI